MGTREAKVENYLNDCVCKRGGLTRKWVSPNQAGVPDRIVILNGVVWFVEIKTINGRLSSRQAREHERLKKAGANVTTLFGKEDVDLFMRNLC